MCVPAEPFFFDPHWPTHTKSTHTARTVAETEEHNNVLALPKLQTPGRSAVSCCPFFCPFAPAPSCAVAG